MESKNEKEKNDQTHTTYQEINKINEKNTNYIEEEYSASINLKDLQFSKSGTKNALKSKNEERFNNIIKNLDNREINVIPINRYGNSIVIGTFCNSIAFISYGLYKSRVISNETINVWSVMAMFGGLGQLTSGFMELIKGNEHTSFIYIIYGLYCLTHYLLRILTDRFGDHDLLIFFIFCLILSIPCILYSLKTNFIFLLQTSITSIYFLINAIGEGLNEYTLIEQVSGSFLILSGFLSFYIFLSQLFKLYYGRNIPTFPLKDNNKIDSQIIENKVHQN